MSEDSPYKEQTIKGLEKYVRENPLRADWAKDQLKRLKEYEENPDKQLQQPIQTDKKENQDNVKSVDSNDPLHISNDISNSENI